MIIIGDAFGLLGASVSIEQGELCKGERAAQIQGKPIEGGVARLRGIASVDVDDREGESIAQDGIDWRPFLEHGYFNDDHRDVRGPEGGKPEGAAAIIGHPTRVERVRHGGNDASRVHGVLYTGLPRAASYFDLARAMQGQDGLAKSQRRTLGLSVQGGILERKGKRILRSVVRHCALTPWPVNPDAFVEELVKSLGAKGLEAAPLVQQSGAVVTPERLARAIAKVYGVGAQDAQEAARDMMKAARGR
jgi:hypothetical protein